MNSDEIRDYEPFWNHWYIDACIQEGLLGSVYRIHSDFAGHHKLSLMKVIIIGQQNTAQIEPELNTKQFAAKEYYQELMSDVYEEIKTIECINFEHILPYEEHMIFKYKPLAGYAVMLRMEQYPTLREVPAADKSCDELIRLGIQISDALIFCHSNGIIHRYMSPDSIFIDENKQYLLGSFGVIPETELSKELLETEAAYPFLAPELFGLTAIDARVDIYSLGKILAYYSGKLREVHSYELDKVIEKACATEPQKRYQSAKELKEALVTVKLFMETQQKPVKKNIEDTVKVKVADKKIDKAVQVDAVDKFNKKTVKADSEDKLINRTVKTDSEDKLINKTVKADSKEKLLNKTVQATSTDKDIEPEKHRHHTSILDVLAIASVTILAAAFLLQTAMTIMNGQWREDESCAVLAEEVSESGETFRYTYIPEGAEGQDAAESNGQAAKSQLDSKGQDHADALGMDSELKGTNPAAKDMNSESKGTDPAAQDTYSETQGTDSNVQEPTQPTPAATPVILNLRRKELDSLDSIEKLKSATILNLSFNKLSNIIPINEAVEVTALDLSHNAITTTVALRKLTKLETLNLSYNKIDKLIGIEKLQSLEVLNLNHNQISDLTLLGKLENVTVLSLADNNLTDIDALKSLTSLKMLDIRHNEISKKKIAKLIKQLPDCIIIYE